MRTGLIAAFFALALPLSAFAAVSAGFPSAALWLSESTIYAGDSVTISTALYNSSTTTVSGTVDFLVDGSSVGSSDFSLDPGKSGIFSTAWTASEGSHSFSAHIKNATGASGSISLQSGDASAITVAVGKAPEQPTVSVASLPAPVQSLLASAPPSVSAAAQNAIQLSEAVRQGAANYVQQQLNTETASAKPSGEVLGTSTYRAPTSTASAAAVAQSWWQIAWHFILVALLAITKSVALFYPVVAFLIFFLLYLAVKTLRRPSRY